MDIDYFDIGFQAAKLLDMKIQKKTVENENLLIPPTGVVSRESTSCLIITDEIIREAIAYIAENYKKNIQISDVVNNFHISRRSLEKRFKGAVGHTIHEEISRLRLDTIKKLLLETNKSIKVLSREAGYSNEYHMRRAFKMATGMLPKEFRANQRS